MGSKREYSHLTDEEVASFMKCGYLKLEGCFTRDAAAQWTSDIWTRLGFDPSQKTTWVRERTNMPTHRSIRVSEFAPKAWKAICELCGGEDRVDPKSDDWNDGFIVNLGSPEHEGEELRPKELDGWHVDGDFFQHFLDSPEQAMLIIPLWSDIVPNGGGTVICTDGMREVAKHLYEHPEGVSPRMVPQGEQPKHRGLDFYKEIVQGCNEFHEMTGKAGDVILLHPLMLHSATHNGLRKFRVITNPPVSLKEPFKFDREDGRYSLVELKTMKLVEWESLKSWKIQGRRQNLVPERLRLQAVMKEEEDRRLKI